MAWVQQCFTTGGGQVQFSVHAPGISRFPGHGPDVYNRFGAIAPNSPPPEQLPPGLLECSPGR
jgi:hypothetical protein